MNNMLEFLTGARDNKDYENQTESPVGTSTGKNTNGPKKAAQESNQKLPAYLQKPKFDEERKGKQSMSQSVDLTQKERNDDLQNVKNEIRKAHIAQLKKDVEKYEQM